MQFTTCAFIVSPLGYLWLENLESWFPGTIESNKSREKPEKGARSESKAEKPRLNVKNTVTKVLIDQTIGSAWNTALFIMVMGMLQGLDYGTIQTQIQQVRNLKIASIDGPSTFDSEGSEHPTNFRNIPSVENEMISWFHV